MRHITSACNYREGEEGEPKIVVGPFLSLSDEEQAEGKTIESVWPSVEAHAKEIVAEHPGVSIVGTDLDTTGHIGFLDLGCDEAEPLLACLVGLSRMGFCTGVV